MIELERNGAVAVLRFDRPAQANALDIPSARQLHQLARQVAGDSSIRCVVLTGKGKAFCAGGDVTAFGDNADDLPGYLGEIIGEVNLAASQLMRMDKPFVTLVNGAAAGAGLSLALSGDVVIAGKSASFLAAYGGVGLTPDAGLSWLLPRLIGLRRAQEMIIANKHVRCEEAETIGLVTRVVEDEQLAEEGMKTALRLASSATQAIGAARALLLESFEQGYETQLQKELQEMARAGARAEAREGVSAYLDGRKPDFGKGKA